MSRRVPDSAAARAAAESVACPRCGAPPGKPCDTLNKRTGRSRRLDGPHAARRSVGAHVTPAWLATLADPVREAVFAWMRETGNTSLRDTREGQWLYGGQNAHGQGPVDTIPVGADHFDSFIKGETAEEYLRVLRRGGDPRAALVGAKAHARLCVAKHNAQRSRDVHWQRWEGTADSSLDHLHRMLIAALGRVGYTLPPEPVQP